MTRHSKHTQWREVKDQEGTREGWRLAGIQCNQAIRAHSGTGTGMANSIPKFWERECEWKIPFPSFRNGNASGKFHSQFLGTGIPRKFAGNPREFPGKFLPQFSGMGMRVENSIPNFREREFPINLGETHRNSQENFIPNFWERECEWKIPFTIFGNGNDTPLLSLEMPYNLLTCLYYL